VPEYRRNWVPGGTFFFTVVLADRRSTLLVDRVDALREAVRSTRVARPFQIDAWVVLPEHLHCIWTLPPGDTDFPGRWGAIKRRFSSAIPATEARRAVQARRGERAIWQRRFWEHTIRDEADYAAHMDYVHFNPVRHGYAETPGAWPFSTFRRCVALGMYPAEWAGGDGGVEVAGER
jgi:putative transposase